MCEKGEGGASKRVKWEGEKKIVERIVQGVSEEAMRKKGAPSKFDL